MNKVLIVDDCLAARESIKRLKIWSKEDGFFIVDEAENGYEALEKLKGNPVDLVITDIRMPKINGIELLKKIKENELAPFVVLLTDFSEFGYAKDGLKFGADDYLLKPVHELELIELLDKLGKKLFQRKVELEDKRFLEKKLEESSVYDCQKEYISKIVTCLGGSKSEVMVVIEKLLDCIENIYGGDGIEMVCILQRAIRQIWTDSLDRHSWLKLFTYNKTNIQLPFQLVPRIDLLKEMFINTVLQLNETIIKYKPAKNDRTIMKICEFVLGNIDKEMSTDSIAKKFFFDKPYLCKLFRKKANMTLTEYIVMVKMEQAKIFLCEHDWSTSEISERLGYRNTNYFCKVFKKYTGTSIKSFRDLNR